MSAAAQVIKDRLGIAEVVGSYIKIESAGSNYKAKCPFHNEKTPSFFISPGRGTYYCFGCGMKGDIFSFVQEYEKTDFMGALKILAERAGVELGEFKSESYQKFDRQYKVLDMAAHFFESRLNDIHREYLYSRGLTDETIKAWRIGFAPDEWRSLLEFMQKQTIGGKPVVLEDLIETGLVKRAESSGSDSSGREKVYDRFRSRIMFPLSDATGRVIAFSGRIYGKDEKEFGPKYLNSPDMELFNKSEILYGFDKAKQMMRERGYAILVEGQLDLILSHQVGISNSVATSGTALTREHLAKIGRMTKNIVFMYDSDNAGYGATRRGERLALEQGFDIKVVTLPAGEDPASLIVKDKQAFLDALKKSTNITEYYLGILLAKFPAQHDLVKAIERELVPDIALIGSAIRRSELVAQISLKAKISEKAIAEEVEKQRSDFIKNGGFKGQEEARLGRFDLKNGSESGKENDSSADSRAGAPQGAPAESGNKNRLHSSSKSVDVALRRAIALTVFIDGKSDQAKVAEMKAKINAVLSEEDKEVAKLLEEEQRDALLFEAEMLFGDVKVAEQQLKELVDELEERSLKESLTRYMSELQLAEKAQDKVKSDEIIAKCQEISLKLSHLHRRRRET